MTCEADPDDDAALLLMFRVDQSLQLPIFLSVARFVETTLFFLQ